MVIHHTLFFPPSLHFFQPCGKNKRFMKQIMHCPMNARGNLRVQYTLQSSTCILNSFPFNDQNGVLHNFSGRMHAYFWGGKK